MQIFPTHDMQGTNACALMISDSSTAGHLQEGHLIQLRAIQNQARPRQMFRPQGFLRQMLLVISVIKANLNQADQKL